MKTTMKYVSLVLSLLIVGNSYAYLDVNSKSKGKDKGKPSGGQGSFTGKANCAPPNDKLTMEFNDVRAFLSTTGVLFYDRNNQVAAYEVPKSAASSASSARLTAIFAASLWMGGTDVNGQLKLAAAKFGDGNDFWTGPLTITPGSGNYNPLAPVGDDARRSFGDANIDPDQCATYDKFFTIRKAEVISFITWWECNNVVPAADGCDEVNAPDSDVLNRIINWPAHGDESLNQDFYLAPFYDRSPDGGFGGNGIYNPLEEGDYPWYDDILGRDDIECGADRRVSLFGDETHWWVFNDKGNIHTESNGDPIGMEIRAQAFAFTTNDEVNRMTFYNYEMINRGTQTLQDTYFAQYVDPDLGGYDDDYVGCDVSRGLGYCFNGDNFDQGANGRTGYGANPPAIGVDFFEGPYQDADGVDNPGPVVIDGVFTTPTVAQALAAGGIVYKGLGIGYGDGIVDNERFGMKTFSYYTNGAQANQSDPTTAAQFYNYMRGRWRFGEQVFFGGTGFPASSPTTIETSYCFPGDSDTLHWATKGVNPGFQWDETTNNNPPGDRRFVQSAGPFTLRPGAINNITVGVVYARGSEGDLFSSVRALKRADTKAQALFDACFRILDPPNAPDLKIVELENELILTLENPINSNNADEDYEEEDDINIVDPTDGTVYDKFYRFEGYQIFQMKDATASVADISDVTKARLVAQCDIVNGVSRLINFEFDEELGFSIPTEKVDGENKGIRHTFSVKEDLFAQGNRVLVNHKSYYYIAVAYAFNEFKKYDPNDPTLLDGQKMPYIASRIKADGSAISPIQGIPHSSLPSNGGAYQYAEYGTSPRITRLDGIGNGNRALEFTRESLVEILTTGKMDAPTYDYGSGPLNIKVVDPLNLAGGYFTCKFKEFATPNGINQTTNHAGLDTASWVIYRYANKGDATPIDSVESKRTINNQNEQIISQWGISVEITQIRYTRPGSTSQPPLTLEYDRWTAPISSELAFKDSSKRWLSFVQDNDAYFPTNWILAGSNIVNPTECLPEEINLNPCLYSDFVGVDPDQVYEKLLGGGAAPSRLVNSQTEFSPLAHPSGTNGMSAAQVSQVRIRNSISRLPSVKIVLTKDKTKWTKCAVIELCRDSGLSLGGALPGRLRKSPSKDINGNQISGSTGMSYFPGYAIDMERGVRLHMAFGENSYLGSDGGSDMVWNPSSRLVDNVGNPVMGGNQPIYVFGYETNDLVSSGLGCPEYSDATSTWVYDKMASETSFSYRDVYMNLSWIVFPLLAEDKELLSTDATIDLRINKEYSEYTATGDNNGVPMYGWSMDDLAAQVGSRDALADAMKLINVVPNPYYAYSAYETSKLDNRIKITNLPENCTIKIYNTSGKLIKTIKKSNATTFQDWNLKNEVGIPVSSGIYMIHVEVPSVGDVILKCFVSMRSPDLEGI
jgi:hypothetical protein